MLDHGYALVKPCFKDVSLTPGMRDKLVGALATRYDCNTDIIAPLLQAASVNAYGRLRQTFSEEGETMVAAQLVRMSAEDSRDASYIRVSALSVLADEPC